MTALIPEAKPSVVEVMLAAMRSVTSIGKSDFNDFHKFNFRGIDTVLDKVGPAFREHGVLTFPKLLTLNAESVKSSKDKPMRLTTVTVRYTFVGPAGDREETEVPGEAWDSEDKGSSKAMSVAYRTALIQVLSIPTKERDPHAGPVVSTKLAKLREEAKQLTMGEQGWTFEQLADEYTAWSQGADIAAADEADMEKFVVTLRPKQTMRRGSRE
jgi:hypothetical protein